MSISTMSNYFVSYIRKFSFDLAYVATLMGSGTMSFIAVSG